VLVGRLIAEAASLCEPSASDTLAATLEVDIASSSVGLEGGFRFDGRPLALWDGGKNKLGRSTMGCSR
jgi:hypothetical protein